ncbi:uncharacterized protein Dwil_GK22257, isoform A [Drosophila willistoni]|uniref:Uncharacterized protein, isoform A n=1 Tax=Drosophila willistoni TaxID=7260 RepID=B4MYP0_DROWI|nr:U-scoloptoxin(19)-Sm1a isoform X1 [Drosophila willistoni]EDW77229.1 uncharacterized protein Dwil_GK22257, isoform A [Drosophila willistoni]
MSLKNCLVGLCLWLAALQIVCADIETNEVNEYGRPEYYMLQGVRVYPNNRECVLVGGLCVRTSECTELTSKKGLCPDYAHLGVECCYELPIKPAPCTEHLGVCMNRCPQRLVRPGNDCENGQVCCVVV